MTNTELTEGTEDTERKETAASVLEYLRDVTLAVVGNGLSTHAEFDGDFESRGCVNCS